MSGENVEARVRQVLEGINTHRWRDLSVPHGFTLEAVTVDEYPNEFAPAAGMTERRVTTYLRVPVIYSADPRFIPLRAALPAQRGNLDALQTWIDSRVREVFGSGRLSEWTVTPARPPHPYFPDGTPNGPPSAWSVRAVIVVT